MNKYTDEDFLDVTESGNKLVIFAFLTLIVGISVFGYYYVFQKMHFSLKTVNLELGEEISTDINDYLSKKVIDTSGYKIDTSKVKNDEIGTYPYSVSYNKFTKKGKIKVVDTTPPNITLKEVSIEEDDEDFYLGDFLETCEDASKPCLVTLKNSKDETLFQEIGTHSINIVVSDIYNNKTEATAKLIVVESGTLVKEEELDLVFEQSEEELPNFNEDYYIKLDKALPQNSEDAEDIIETIDVTEVENYVKENYPNYSLKEVKIVNMYNKSNYIIGFVVKITLGTMDKDIVVYYKQAEAS